MFGKCVRCRPAYPCAMPGNACLREIPGFCRECPGRSAGNPWGTPGARFSRFISRESMPGPLRKQADPWQADWASSWKLCNLLKGGLVNPWKLVLHRGKPLIFVEKFPGGLTSSPGLSLVFFCGFAKNSREISWAFVGTPPENHWAFPGVHLGISLGNPLEFMQFFPGFCR